MNDTLMQKGQKYRLVISDKDVWVVGHDFGPRVELIADYRPFGVIVKMGGFRAWIARDQQEYVPTEYWALGHSVDCSDTDTTLFVIDDVIAPGRKKYLLEGWLIRQSLRYDAVKRMIE